MSRDIRASPRRARCQQIDIENQRLPVTRWWLLVFQADAQADQLRSRNALLLAGLAFSLFTAAIESPTCPPTMGLRLRVATAALNCFGSSILGRLVLPPNKRLIRSRPIRIARRADGHGPQLLVLVLVSEQPCARPGSTWPGLALLGCS